MVEIDTTTKRVNACLLIHGAPAFVRFDDENSFEGFRQAVNGSGTYLQIVTGQDNTDLLIRPASVDLIVKGATPQ